MATVGKRRGRWSRRDGGLNLERASRDRQAQNCVTNGIETSCAWASTHDEYAMSHFRSSRAQGCATLKSAQSRQHFAVHQIDHQLFVIRCPGIQSMYSRKAHVCAAQTSHDQDSLRLNNKTLPLLPPFAPTQIRQEKKEPSWVSSPRFSIRHKRSTKTKFIDVHHRPTEPWLLPPLSLRASLDDSPTNGLPDPLPAPRRELVCGLPS